MRRTAYVHHMRDFHSEVLCDHVFESDAGWLVVRMDDEWEDFAICVWDGFPHVRVAIPRRETMAFPLVDYIDYIPF
jgi:hypothetical protein